MDRYFHKKTFENFKNNSQLIHRHTVFNLKYVSLGFNYFRNFFNIDSLEVFYRNKFDLNNSKMLYNLL